ncbi:peptide deformylase 4 [Actinorhabdospora filicis]|uniref:Peptide deformylase n=1 Tax=Actinorhabdospora filicis TaxID=1785913 RepID=A0A9W6SMY8_9ACTN|nr:peptide deformylase [Actinorhabdospora filicis]GLZ79173.1 peptide deformylase 4 [Actinorhabdospora filicis]
MTDAPQGTARPITLYGTPVLHKACAPVEKFDDELAQLIADMFASMYAANGVGLAANQIGVDARVFVVDCPDANDEHLVAHVVNPVLDPAPAPRELETDMEGCLSVPGEYHELTRTAVATVRGFDMHGNPVVYTGDGTLARCFQHETDHLDGTVYVDRLPRKIRKELLENAGLAELD